MGYKKYLWISKDTNIGYIYIYIYIKIDITYKDLLDYLARGFHGWYTKFKPSSPAVVSAGDPKVGTVVLVESVH